LLCSIPSYNLMQTIYNAIIESILKKKDCAIIEYVCIFPLKGFGGMDVSMKKGVRFTTYMGYLKPIMDRLNLTIYRYAKALKVHLDDENRAVGVTYYRHGLMKYAKATKEIILSAGAVMTPKILMHSGIGPEYHLEQVGIKPKINLPVGQNLQDHIFAVVGPLLLNQPASYILDRDTNLRTLVDYFSNGSGPIVSISGIGGAGFFASSMSRDNYPDMYLNHVGVGVHATFGKDLDEVFNFKNHTMERYYAPYVGKDAFFFVVNLGKVKSIGEIKLKSSDEFEYPSINPRYLSHPHDVQNMVEGVKMGLKIYENTTAFGRLGARLVSTKLPGCEQHELRSDAYWECYVRHYTLTVYHPCCTARAGAVNDSRAVVDSDLRVLGAKNLRIVDASVMPTITNSNLNAPTIMIGEKGSDLILKYWSNKT